MEGELRFTIHARERMAEYRVDPNEIREALANVRRERTGPASIIRWGTTDGGRRIKVVLDRADPRWVITLHVKGEGG